MPGFDIFFFLYKATLQSSVGKFYAIFKPLIEYSTGSHSNLKLKQITMMFFCFYVEYILKALEFLKCLWNFTEIKSLVSVVHMME